MSGECILVVEDNQSNRKLIKALLLSAKYEVHVVEDAEQAQEVLALIHPHLILMDIQLPGIDGLTFTRNLKADPKTQAIPVVALTAYAMRGDQQKALDGGCDAYIGKPIDRVPFLNAIRACLDAKTSSVGVSGQEHSSRVDEPGA